MDTVQPGLYVHYKGGRYRALFTATHSETLVPLVIYMSMETGEIFARPDFMWNETVQWPDGPRARFMLTKNVFVRHSISSNEAQ